MVQRTKKNSTTLLVYEDKEFKFKKFTRFYEFDVVLRKWVKSREEKVTYESLESHGLTKKPIEVSAIFIKERESDTLMSGVEISFYLATFKFEIPEIKGYEHAYLSFNEEEKTVSMNLLNSGASFIIDFNQKEFCTLVSEPKRISREQASKLMKGSVYPHFLKMHGGLIAVVSHFQIARP